MTTKIGNVFKGIGRVFRHEASEVKAAAKQVTQAMKTGGDVGGALKNASREVKDSFVDIGGSAVGFAGLLGFRYSVKEYSHQVSPTLTRGSRLDGNMAELTAMGFRGVVNLCAENDADTVPARQVGINPLHLEIIDNTAPTNAQMKQFLDFVTAPENQPAYVHCQAGKGRTGVAVACYQMAVKGMPLDAALADAKAFGLAVPEQIDFLEQFSKDLAAGKIAGYPKAG